MTQDFDLEAFQDEVKKELQGLQLRRIGGTATGGQEQLLKELLETEPGKQDLTQHQAEPHSTAEDLIVLTARERVNIQQANELLKRKDIRAILCPALQSAGNDAFDIAKIITPILAGLAIAGTVAIPLVPILFSSIALLISRMGIAGLCTEYEKKAKEQAKEKK